MTLNDYREQYRKNMMIMSRTANGRLDVSASATKKDAMVAGSADRAKQLALENTDRAVDFLFSRRALPIRSEADLGKLIIRAAEIANRGIVKEGCLFRSGADSDKFAYTRIADLPAMWNWFIGTFYRMLNDPCFKVPEIAAFCEYMINMVGHFFSDGCGKISMLISTYVFMRFDLPCPVYTSRDEYYRMADRSVIPSLSDMDAFLENPGFRNFTSYYLSLCQSRTAT